MKRSISLFGLLLIFRMQMLCQNDVYFTSTSGIPFQVIYDDSLVNRNPETTVLIKNVTGEKMKALIKTGNRKDTVVLFLLEKGKPVQNKEFLFEIVDEGNKLTAKYSTVHNRSARGLVVAQPPKKDSSFKIRESKCPDLASLDKGRVTFANRIPQTGCVSAMSEECMGVARVILGKAKSEDEKLKLSEDIVQNNCVTVSHLQELLENLPYELDRVKLVKKAAPHVVDKTNHPRLKESFKLESAYKHVESYFTDKSSALKEEDLCSVPASETEINTLAEILKTADNDGKRLQSINVHRKNHCYSVSQVRTILKTFVHDRDRLEAAKLLYHTTIDKKDFEKLGEEFTYPQWMKEFNAFVRGQAGK